MNDIVAYIKKRGKVFVKGAFAGLSCVVLCTLSGCITASPEDDYVAGVLAEAMQSSGGTPVTTPTPHSAVSVPQAGGTVSIVQPQAVSVPAPVSVQVPVVNTVASTGVVAVATVPPGAQATAATVASTNAAAPVPAPAPSARPQPAVPTIQPDSVLWINVSEDPSLNGRYMVNDASAIDFGYVGLVFLPDMTIDQAEAEVKRVLEGRYLKTATVSVKLAKASYDRVGVQGSVEVPGDIKIGPGATISLSDALRRAGGIRGNRENCRVKIVRGGLKTPFGAAAEGEVSSLVTQEGQLKVPEVFLRNDDLIYVFTPATDTAQGIPGSATSAGAGGKRVVLLGEVPRRGVIEFAENEPCTLMYLLFKIGGLPRFARADSITVVRRNKDGTEKSYLVDGDKLMVSGKPEDDIVLETGDRIVVPARKISFF